MLMTETPYVRKEFLVYRDENSCQVTYKSEKRTPGTLTSGMEKRVSEPPNI